jgi:hypothetical protein
VAAYTENTEGENMTDAKRFSILGAFLEGGKAEPMYKDLIHMTDKKAALDLLWAALKLSYEREDHYMQKICAISAKPAVENTITGMQELQRDMLRCRSLVPQDKVEQLDLHVIVSGFVERLPDRFRQQYVNLMLARALSGTPTRTFTGLVEFVSTSIREMESNPTDWAEDSTGIKGNKDRTIFASYSRYQKSSNTSNYRDNKTGSSNNMQKIKSEPTPTGDRRRINTEHLICSFCHARGHAIWKCPDYLAMSLKQRWDMVRKQNRCPICLGKHGISDCKSKYYCYRCDEAHNSSLCPQNLNNQTFVDMHPGNNMAAYTGSEEDEVPLNNKTVNEPKHDT